MKQDVVLIFTLIFFTKGIGPFKFYEEFEKIARKEILKCGGSLSHHQSVGKLRKRVMNKAIGEPTLSILRGVQKKLTHTRLWPTAI